MANETFGNVLRRLRQNCDLSQGQVCEKLGISQQRLSSWETDKSIPASDALLELLELYEVEDVLSEFGYAKEEYELITPTKQELQLIYTLRHFPPEIVDSFYNLMDLLFKINKQHNSFKEDDSDQKQEKFLIAASGGENASEEEIQEAVEIAKNL